MPAHIKPHNYDLDNNLENNKDEDIMVLFLALLFSIPYYLTFVQLVCNIDEVFYQLYLALPIYQAYTKNCQDKLQKELSTLLRKKTIYHLFTYKMHRLSCYCNPPAIATDQLAVRKYYT